MSCRNHYSSREKKCVRAELQIHVLLKLNVLQKQEILPLYTIHLKEYSKLNKTKKKE